MDTKEFNHFKLEVADAHCDLEQSVQDAMEKFNHQMDVIMDRQEYKFDDSIDVEKNGNILAVPNSDYIYNEIVNRVDCGHQLINLDYDPRLRRTGYTEALGRVAERFYNEHIVVIVDSHDQVERVARTIPRAYEVYTNDFKWIRGSLENNDFVLVDNSVKELEPEMQEALQYELNTKGTVVTFNDLGLTFEEDMPF
jgi:hypothetical protein